MLLLFSLSFLNFLIELETVPKDLVVLRGTLNALKYPIVFFDLVSLVATKGLVGFLVSQLTEALSHVPRNSDKQQTKCSSFITNFAPGSSRTRPVAAVQEAWCLPLTTLDRYRMVEKAESHRCIKL